MMVILIFAMFLIFQNILVEKLVADQPKKWKYAGLIVMFLISPIVLTIMSIVMRDYGVGSGIAVASTGGITFLNGLMFLVYGLFK